MIPDVNVLVAASRSDHPHHAVARSWLEQTLDRAYGGETILGLLPMVATGFLRIVTHPRVFREPTPEPEAWHFLSTLRDSPGVEAITLGPEWPWFEQACRRHELVGNDIPDAWIAAAASAQRLPVATLDRGFRRFLPADALIVLDDN